MRVLITGSAGFIGSELALRLLERGDEVIGVDCLDPYYDVTLKEASMPRRGLATGWLVMLALSLAAG